MSAQHTPGPWHLVESNCSAMVFALDETGSVNRFSAQIDGGYSYGGRTVKERTSPEELNADARLIAAAPDLLEALIDCADQAEVAMRLKGGEGFWAVEAARTAIAKALGKDEA